MRSLALLSCAAAMVVATAFGADDFGVAFLEEKVRTDPGDFIAAGKLGESYLRLLRTTGNDAWLAKAADVAAASLHAMTSRLNPTGLGLRGRVELAQHCFREALATGREWQQLQPGKSGGLVLVSDASFELGDYATAESALREALRIEGEESVGTETRFAKLDLVFGRVAKALERLEHALRLAREESSSVETIAWCEVQRGEIAFKKGRWDEAEKRYEAARAAFPGWYVIDDHLAELLGAKGRFDEAAAAYEKLVARVPRPELFQALGDLHTFAGHPDRAHPRLEKARALYEDSLARGEVLYLHHAAGFYADSLKDPQRALALAQQDLEQRQSIQAWDALAWAEYSSGSLKEAAVSIEKALAAGTRDTHILYHAGMIQMSAGDLTKGKAALKQAAEINPRFQAFHVHR